MGFDRWRRAVVAGNARRLERRSVGFRAVRRIGPMAPDDGTLRISAACGLVAGQPSVAPYVATTIAQATTTPSTTAASAMSPERMIAPSAGPRPVRSGTPIHGLIDTSGSPL